MPADGALVSGPAGGSIVFKLMETFVGAVTTKAAVPPTSREAARAVPSEQAPAAAAAAATAAAAAPTDEARQLEMVALEVNRAKDWQQAMEYLGESHH